MNNRTESSILLGAIDLLSWCDIAPWCISIRETGYTDEVWIIGYRGVSDEIKNNLKKYNINLYEVNHTPFNTPIQHTVQDSPTRSHNQRLYHFWELLSRLNTENYKWCIATDVRDVIFQKNPIEYLENNLQEMQFIAASEGLIYQNEEWGKDNLIKGYGSIFYELQGKELKIYNVGTLGGDARLLKWLFYTLFSMTEGRHYPADQSSYNILISGIMKQYAIPTSLEKSWAAQLGTTHDPTKSYLWDRLTEPRPKIINDKVYTVNNELYYLVHQYNRNPELYKSIKEKYEELTIGYMACGKSDNAKICRKPINHIDECVYI